MIRIFITANTVIARMDAMAAINVRQGGTWSMDTWLGTTTIVVDCPANTYNVELFSRWM